MQRHIRIAFLILLVLKSAACAPALSTITDSDAITTAGYHPLATQTDIAEVDNVLTVVASGDDQQLRSLIQFTTARCTQADGLGGPPKCRPGESEGTAVDVLPFLGSEGSFLHKDEIETWQGIDVTGLYAIYEVSSDVRVEEYYPAGKYAILFVGKEGQPSVVLRLSEGRIVRVDYLPNASPEYLQATLQREAAEIILSPLRQ
jgi:hypothetical protein